MNDLSHQLHGVRPKLSIVAPLTYWICLGYVLVNLAIGFGLYYLVERGRLQTPLFIINHIMTFQFWGIVFLMLASTMGYGLIANNWNFLRKSLVGGITIKVIWLAMLITRSFSNPAVVLWAAIWAFMLFIQIGTYIYFLPTLKGAEHGTQ